MHSRLPSGGTWRRNLCFFPGRGSVIIAQDLQSCIPEQEAELYENKTSVLPKWNLTLQRGQEIPTISLRCLPKWVLWGFLWSLPNLTHPSFPPYAI